MMSNTDKNATDRGRCVIAFGESKEASLYFDRVLPIDSFDRVTSADPKIDPRLIQYDSPDVGRIAQSLIGVDEFTSVTAYLSLLVQFHQIYYLSLFKSAPARVRHHMLGTLSSSKLPQSFQEDGIDFECLANTGDQAGFEAAIDKLLVEKIQPVVRATKFAGSPLWGPLELLPDLKSETRYSLALKNLELIDVANISWDAIIEFRRDEESRRALRDFRLFFSEQLADKSEAYISDKLESLHDTYVATAKGWGFDLKSQIAASIMSVETLAASSIATLAAAQGAPGLVAAGGAAVLTLGKAVIDIKKVQTDIISKRLSSPIRYIASLRNLEPKGTLPRKTG